MKNLICCLFFFVCLLGSAQEKKTPVVGAWNLAFAQVIEGGKIVGIFPGDFKGSNVKIWSENYCLYVGLFKQDTATINNYGGGPYKLEGTHCEETILYHANKNAVGHTTRMLYEMKGDTLIQTYPVDQNWKINPSSYRVEKYVRIK